MLRPVHTSNKVAENGYKVAVSGNFVASVDRPLVDSHNYIKFYGADER